MKNSLLGCQRPRFANFPEADSHGQGDGAAILSELHGLVLDDWQAFVVRHGLATRGGKLAAARVGLAVPRQNGKNAILEAVELYKMVRLGRRILHTAHEVKTARKAFLRLLSYFDNPREYPELAAMARTVRKANGQEAILLHNGGGIEFVARSSGSGRGFTVDDLVLDEAQQLDEDALAALLPTTSAAPSGDPQLWVTGTPPSASMRGDVFARMRAEGVAGTNKRLAWFEWSVPADADPDDRGHWAATNPALGRRLNIGTLEDERGAFDDETFLRERLGQWLSDTDNAVIPMDLWSKRATDDPPTEGPVVFALDMSPGRTSVAIAAARLSGESAHVEVVEHRSTASGTKWVVTWLEERRGKCREVIIDSASPAASLVPELKARRVPVRLTSAQDMARACGGLVDAVHEGTVTHFNQPALNRALQFAKTRDIGTEQVGWGWSRKTTDTDITPLVAATLARYGVMAQRPKRKSKAVIM